MKRTSLRRVVVPTAAALALGLGVTACGAGNDSGSTGSTGGSSSSSSSSGGTLSGTLNGGGSSAQEKAQDAWRAGFQTANSGVTVNYDPVGSGDGVTNFSSGAYAYAGSDAYLSDDQLPAAKKRCGGTDPIEVPAYVSPIAIVFNLKGVTDLDLSADVIAKIFTGKITKWNDSAISTENPKADLPDTTITPVHRADDSGTTNNLTQYLSAASGGNWSYDPSSTWPLKGGESAQMTSGLVGAVQDGNGTIGYADDSAAGDLSVAAIKVGSDYVKPSADGAAKALALSKAVSGRPSVDMAIDVDRTTTEAGTYPLLLASYLIACQSYSDAGQGALVKGFLTYAVSTAGQSAAASAAGSAPLDSSLQTKAAAIVAAVK